MPLQRHVLHTDTAAGRESILLDRSGTFLFDAPSWRLSNLGKEMDEVLHLPGLGNDMEGRGTWNRSFLGRWQLVLPVCSTNRKWVSWQSLVNTFQLDIKIS